MLMIQHCQELFKMTGFAEFNLDPRILVSLEKMGFQEPSPIQAATMPLILKGHDIIALAETGSGKTAACAIPLCHMVNVESKKIQGLIIVPTRELCLQYAVEAQKIGKEKGVKAFAMYGGEPMGLQLAKIKAGVQLLVATPGRLIDCIHSRAIDLSHIKTLVLDEADEMLSMGFFEDLEFIIQCLVQPHATLLFSATIPPRISLLGRKYMNQPHEVKLSSNQKSPKNLDHQFVYVKNVRLRSTVLSTLIQELAPKQSLVFCESRRQVEEVTRDLKRSKLMGVDFLHGGLAQNLRSQLTSKFRAGKIRTLVVTDVAARGLDFSEVTHVFIFQLGKDIDTYVHRSGRTGRSGREGLAISLVTSYELSLLPPILKKIGREINWLGEAPDVPSHTNSSPKSSGARGGKKRRPSRFSPPQTS
ncbi:MAG: DEAD/DEAH box helicase [Verrucomicrobia bacterium]|nr:DEAD/DEAH box helicase [Verrucomicrobiota bacterium]